MAVITFCSNEIKETGQTLSMAAIASYMAIEHNYKILMISTGFNDLTLENCFWEYNKIRSTGGVLKQDVGTIGLVSGVEGLIKALNTNRTNTEIVRNYSKIVLKNRLDVLLSPNTRSYQEYVEIAKYYTEILQTANKFYDFVFVDLSKRMPPKEVTEILQTSDIIVMNLTQRLRTIDDFIALRENSEFYRRKNIILNIGRYDKFSKYNDKNITKYLREKQQVSVVPYNTLFFEACSEGTVIDLLLKLRSITDDTDRNVMFVKELKNLDNNIIVKMQELQMKK
ncbi:MAG: hypothetical protein ACM67R_01170 [Clostridiales bacterium]|jgi:MinD-like ATPase involved in chromosome partitioning or flagellar assembly|nr:putative uncharacterized protein [Clostridium sp. CAG:567]